MTTTSAATIRFYAELNDFLPRGRRQRDLPCHLRPFTRCMMCNGHLEDVDKDLVAGRLEAGTRDAFARFRRCRACDRVYWEGSHHRRLLELVARARAEGA